MNEQLTILQGDYETFLRQKRIVDTPTGITRAIKLGEHLFDFQAKITEWALRRGRAAIFADCGLGKTLMQLEWAEQVWLETEKPVLILAPLAVAAQTVQEGAKFGIKVTLCRSQADVQPGINITNYEMLHHFDPEAFAGVALDESSILKSYDGKFRNRIINWFRHTPYKSAWTATPAPNDHMELGNHAEFLGVCTRAEMLAMFFTHDGGDTSKWRIKGHAQTAFWKWLCSWAVNIRKPSDMGFEDGGFILPELILREEIVETSAQAIGTLIPMPAHTLAERREARKGSLGQRVEAAANHANANGEQWLVWCDLNRESEALAKSIQGAIEVQGSDSPEKKTQAMADFTSGNLRVLVTKPSIAGFGMNWQNCHNVIFVGLSDSYELFYQAIRRCWRFGQKHPVKAYIIISSLEGAVLANIKRKEKDAQIMADEMVKHMTEFSEVSGVRREKDEYKTDVAEGRNWTLHLGDCVDVARKIESDSIHFSIFSPPFASLYTYSNSDRDMGNARTFEEFEAHFQFLVKELFRITMPGRLCSFHCMNLPISKQAAGYIGIRDFRGQLIKAFESEGWIFHSEVCIWKDPVIAMQRTKALGLLHKQIKKDSCMSRQGIPDYLVTMRKPGENPERVSHTNETFPVEVWQKYASPVWMDIDPGDTLQRESAREHNDERHICPLQLQVIARTLELWSNPGDLVFSPFSGIGSEGYMALKMGRKFLGVELKQSYWKQAKLNLAGIESAQEQDMFADKEPSLALA